MTIKDVRLQVLPGALPHCPWCGVELHALSGQHPTVSVGSLSVCDQCYGIGVFTSTETLELRRATDEEVSDAIEGLKRAGNASASRLLAACSQARKDRA